MRIAVHKIEISTRTSSALSRVTLSCFKELLTSEQPV
jgi:hypothetical protein